MRLSTTFLLGAFALGSSLHFAGHADAVPTNLATSGTANASSFHTDYIDLGLNGPENAINGLRSSRNAFNDEIIYHGLQSSVDPNTQYQTLWYEIDLGTDYYLDRVQIFSRLSPQTFTQQFGASGQHVIQNFRIDVFNILDENVFSQTYLPSKSTDDEPWAASDMRGVLGSRVRITRDPRHKILGIANSTLILAEFEVWGESAPPLENLALGRPVTATPSLTFGSVPLAAENAVDGNLSGHFWHESVYESDSSGGAPFTGPFGNGHFWQVELDEPSTINYVTVYARTDGEPSDAQAAAEWSAGVLDFRNGPIRISVIDDDGTTVVDSIDTTLGGDDLGMQRYDLTEVFASNPVGKFVRIESLDTTKTLTFGEVEVFGTAVPVDSLGGAEVPEPNGLIAIVLVCLACICFGRHRRKVGVATFFLLASMLVQTDPTTAQPTNLSVAGTVSASSELGENVAANANDGDRVGNIIWHSANAPVPEIYGMQHWYEIDLGSDYYLDRLQIFPRNQYQDTVKNFTLTVFDSDDNVVFSDLFLEEKTTGDEAWGTTAIRNVHGSRVRIIRDPPHAQWDRAMTFAEFEVWGQSTPIAENIALGQPVTSATPLVDAGPTGPELAVDGEIAGHFWLESVFVTDGTTPPYTGPFGNGHFWQVELDEPTEINYVNVFARADVVTENGPIRISVIGSDGTTVVTSADTTLGGMDFNADRYDVTQVFAGNPVGSFVRIEALDTNLKLALAEVEVFGPAPVIEGLPGDFNDDGKVDAADYTVWRDRLGSTDPNALSGNGDETGGSQNLVDTVDYNLWVANFGQMSMASGQASAQHVPEPASLALVTVIGLSLAIGARRRLIA